MTALSTRGGQLAVATAAVLVARHRRSPPAARSAAASGTADKAGRPSAAVSSSPHGGVAYATAKVLASTRAASAPPTRGARSTPASSSPARSSSTATSRCCTSSSPTSGGRRDPLGQHHRPQGGRRRPSGSSSAPTTTPRRRAARATPTTPRASACCSRWPARIKNRPTPYTIVFVAFGAEEDGSLGAQRLRAQHERRGAARDHRHDRPRRAGRRRRALGRRAAPAAPPGCATTPSAPPDSLGVPLVTSPEAPRPAGRTSLAPADDVPFADAGIATAIFSAVSWKASKGRPRRADRRRRRPSGILRATRWRTSTPTYPGRVRPQLRRPRRASSRPCSPANWRRRP